MSFTVVLVVHVSDTLISCKWYSHTLFVVAFRCQYSLYPCGMLTLPTWHEWDVSFGTCEGTCGVLPLWFIWKMVITCTLCVWSVGPTVFRERNFAPSRGIWPLPRNFRVSAEFHGIPRKHGNSAATAKFRNLYCCCNCDMQSHRTATQACWFQWRDFTFSLLTYLSFYLPDLCRWRWPVISTIDWWVMTIWLIWQYHIISLISLSDWYDWSHQNLKPSTLI